MKNHNLLNLTVSKSQDSLNRIPTFDNLELERFNLNLSGVEINEDEKETVSIGFSVPAEFSDKPLQYLIFLMKTCKNISLKKLYNKITFETNSVSPIIKSIEMELEDFTMEHTVEFIKSISPSRKSFTIDELNIVEEYKYAMYSTFKFLDELLIYSNGIIFFDNLDEIISTFEEYKKNKI